MLSNLPDPGADHTSGYRDPGGPLTIGVQSLADGTCLVSVWGEVDLYTAPHLKRVLADATRAGDRDLLVEFSRDSFIDSSGLSVLLQAARSLQALGRSLRVTTDNPHTRTVIETMSLTGRLGLVDSSAGEPAASPAL